tara:strand:+ start:16 stop:966 length:951 start_codon:yes stop_codon:yes gene_type:complete
MAYAKLAGKLLKYAFKPGIRKSIIKSPLAKRGTLSKMAMKRVKPQALINPNAKRLTKSQMLEGLSPDLKKAGQKRLKQVDVWAEKRKISEGRYAEGLKKKRAYDAKHGSGAFTKKELELRKSGQMRRKDTLPKLEQTSKAHRKAHRESQVRDLTKLRSEYKDLKIQKHGARHHKSGVNTSLPLFDNLPYKDAQKLRKYAKKYDAEFGDVLSNLVDVPGSTKHAMGNIHNSKLHAWMKRVGIDTPPKISPDAPVEVRMKVMQDYIVDLRRQAIKLRDLMNPKDTAKLKEILGSEPMPVEQLTMIKPSLTLKDLGIKK